MKQEQAQKDLSLNDRLKQVRIDSFGPPPEVSFEQEMIMRNRDNDQSHKLDLSIGSFKMHNLAMNF